MQNRSVIITYQFQKDEWDWDSTRSKEVGRAIPREEDCFKKAKCTVKRHSTFSLCPRVFSLCPRVFSLCVLLYNCPWEESAGLGYHRGIAHLARFVTEQAHNHIVNLTSIGASSCQLQLRDQGPDRQVFNDNDQQCDKNGARKSQDSA